MTVPHPAFNEPNEGVGVVQGKGQAAHENTQGRRGFHDLHDRSNEKGRNHQAFQSSKALF
jgi:hypothetical protein